MTSNNNYSYLGTKLEILKPSELIHLIMLDHHEYVRQEDPLLTALATKICLEKSDLFPELLDISHVVKLIFTDMETHQMKEERILFPYILAMEKCIHTGEPFPESCFGDVRNPIRAMENDHSHVEELLKQLILLTDHFTIPENACSLHAELYDRLKVFTDNTFRHIYIENHILFPKSIMLER